MTSHTLDDEIHDLKDFSRSQLLDGWESLFKRNPPKGLSTQLLIRTIAYEMQARAYGRLKATIRKRLEKFAGIGPDDRVGSITPRSPSPDPGARLVREWNGVTHTVDVTDDGFQWQDQRYGSLSEIAREITGARWSGPRFFGLNGSTAS